MATTLTQLHSRIYNDQEWRIWSEMVSKYSGEEDKKFGCDHSMKHWLSVASIASDFVFQAGGNHTEICLADIAGMLHDCGLICGDENHAYNGSRIAQAYLEARYGNGSPLHTTDIAIIAHAIAQHSDLAEINNIIDAAIAFADKVDIARTRLKNQPLNSVQRQVQKIQRIDYKILPYYLMVRYTTDEDFDFKELNWPKAYTIPQKVANYLGKDLLFYLNERPTTLAV